MRRPLRVTTYRQFPIDTKDPTERVLQGLEDIEIGEEVWMHVAPTLDELARNFHDLTRIEVALFPSTYGEIPTPEAWPDPADSIPTQCRTSSQ